MVRQRTSLHVNPSEEMIRVGTLDIRFLVMGDDAHGSVAVFEMTVTAGDRLPGPPHSHDAYEETIYDKEGTLTWTVDDHAIAVGPGQALCIPRGAVHRFANDGDEDARVLVVVTPAVIGPAFFRETAAVIDAAAGGPPDRGALLAIMRRHGLTPVLPPGA